MAGKKLRDMKLPVIIHNGVAELAVDGSRQAVKIQTGSLAVYAFTMLIGVVVLVGIFLVSR